MHGCSGRYRLSITPAGSGRVQIAVTGAHTLDSSMIRGELGMEFRDVDASIVETANDLLRLGARGGTVLARTGYMQGHV